MWVPTPRPAAHHPLGLLLLLPSVGKKETLPRPGHSHPAMGVSVVVLLSQLKQHQMHSNSIRADE